MFARVEMRVSDVEASRRFYGVLAAPDARDSASDVGRFASGEFALVQASEAAAVTRGLHVGFAASSRAAVDAFWQAGVRAGYRDDGRPGLRPQYVGDYYGGFLLDPDGNSVEAVHHAGVRRDGVVDHLWIRVADLGAAHAWYAARSSTAGWSTRVAEATRVQVEPGSGRGTFALVADGRPVTRNAHLAVPAPALAAAVIERDCDGNRVELLADATEASSV